MSTGLGMGGHTLPNEGKSKIWLTPPHILQALGEFDLDPCAAPEPRPWPTAKKHYDITRGEDGLVLPWEGRVFTNPPYTQGMEAWIERMVEHGSGITLIFARTETELWHKVIWPNVKGVLFLEGRLFFHSPEGVRGTSNAGAPSVLLAHSDADVEMLRKSGIKGVLVTATERVLCTPQ